MTDLRIKQLFGKEFTYSMTRLQDNLNAGRRPVFGKICFSWQQSSEFSIIETLAMSMLYKVYIQPNVPEKAKHFKEFIDEVIHILSYDQSVRVCVETRKAFTGFLDRMV